jgi:alpha-ketoglutarate-dependent taurine dioxygenase
MVQEPLFKNIGVSLKSEQGSILSMDRKSLVSLLTDHGVILFRFKNSTQEAFESFTGVLSDSFIKHGAKVRKARSEDGLTQTVTEGHAAIVLHTELHFSPFSPDIMWFYCSKAPQEGGETTVADGVEFYNRLSLNAKNFLNSNLIKYVNIWPESTWRQYMPNMNKKQVIKFLRSKNCEARFEADGSLVYEYITSPIGLTHGQKNCFSNSIAIHQQYMNNVPLFQQDDQKVRHGISLANGQPIPVDLIAEIMELGESITHEIKWEDQDIVLLDNTRMLHGRRYYNPDVVRDILVRMAKVDQFRVESNKVNKAG